MLDGRFVLQPPEKSARSLSVVKVFLLKRVQRKDGFLQAYTTCSLYNLTPGTTYVKNDIKIFDSKPACF